MRRTVKEFKSDVLRIFRKENPTADVSWKKAPRRVKYPTGVEGYRGVLMAVAEGFKTSFLIAEGDDSYTMVR